MAAYRWVDDLRVTCGLTACTPGSAPGPTFGIDYGKPLPLTFTHIHSINVLPFLPPHVCVVCLSVSNFAQTLPNGFARNFQGRLAIG